MPYKLYIAIALATVVTLLIRVLPVLFLAKRKLPQTACDLLLFIPSSIMATIVASEVISTTSNYIGNIPISVPAAIISFLVGYPTKSLFVTIIVSILSYLALENINCIGAYLAQL